MASLPHHYITAEEYLRRERQAETKSEYFDGQMFAMAGASRRHVVIAGNVTAALHAQLRGRDCEVYPADMRVKVSETGLYTYPDVVVACGEPEFEDSSLDTLLNPKVVVEVLSLSTERYDRGAKLAHYQRLSTLSDCILISQDRVSIDHYRRTSAGWIHAELNDLMARLEIQSIECTLSLEATYDRVERPLRAGDPGPPR
jgi:Uma2 family endonuclease